MNAACIKRLLFRAMLISVVLLSPVLLILAVLVEYIFTGPLWRDLCEVLARFPEAIRKGHRV